MRSIRPPRLPRKLLAPLLRGSWQGEEAAWEALTEVEVRSLVARAVHRTWPHPPPRGLDEEDLLAETFLRMIEKASREGGLRPPPDWEDRDDARPWIVRTARNAAISVLRRHASREHELAGDADTRAPRPAVPPGSLDMRRRVRDWVQDRDLRISLLKAGRVTPAPALAHVSLEYVEALERIYVDRAARQPGPPGSGIARSADATWSGVQSWSGLHAHDTRSSQSRLGLAWVLRSDDPHSPEAWAIAAPAEARRGRDTLRKWDTRAARQLDRIVAGESR